MIRIPGWTGRDGTRLPHTTQNHAQFKTYELFLSRIFLLTFSDHGWSWATETTESQAPDKGGLLSIPVPIWVTFPPPLHLVGLLPVDQICQTCGCWATPWVDMLAIWSPPWWIEPSQLFLADLVITDKLLRMSQCPVLIALLSPKPHNAHNILSLRFHKWVSWSITECH